MRAGGVGTDQLIDLCGGEEDGGRIDAEAIDGFEPQLPLTVDALPGFGHEEMAVGGVAAGTRRDIVLVEDGGGIADAMHAEGADDEGSVAVLLELFEQIRARGDLAIFDVEEVRRGAALPELAIAAVNGVEKSDVLLAQLGGEMVFRSWRGGGQGGGEG